MSKLAIARPINGISINGVEYLMDASNEVKYFDSKEDAVSFLKMNGVDDEEIETYLFVEESII